MSTNAVQKESLGAERPRRLGRPPRERAGEVDERILDAARAVFLERGLAGASVDEIASRAGAGKPTIYARFPGKEALFSAVVMRVVEAKMAMFDGHTADGETIEERLADIGATTLHWALVGDTIDLFRLAIAEARRFPELASSVGRMARERSTEAITRLLRDTAQSDPLGAAAAFAPERLPVTARLFMDLVFLPLVMRALLGERLEILRAEVGPHVARSVAFFLNGCRHEAAQASTPPKA